MGKRGGRRGARKALLLAAALLVAPGLAPSPVRAETVTVGAVGSASANLWPTYIGIKQGFFAAEGIDFDLVFVQSNAGVLQQLAANSLDMTVASGLADPIRAIDKGADIAIVRIELQAPPYALLAKPALKTMKDLKGKVISVGGLKDLTRLLLERMVQPNGVNPGDYDMVFAGATSARFSALISGAVDAAILTAPYNFHAEAAGFGNLGLAVTYAKDLPFGATTVSRSWAAAHPETVRKFVAAFTRSVLWFDDRANRDAAMKILMDYSHQDADDVGKSYDFLRDGAFYEPTGKVSMTKLGALVDALKGLDDIDRSFPVDRLVLPGVTTTSD